MKPITFSKLELAEALQRAVQAENYSTPTEIQAQAIPHLLAGRDLLGCAQTGTGKTAAFALPILHLLETQRTAAVPGVPRMLVLSPTRELAAQIGDNFQTYGRFVHFRQAIIFGGVKQTGQVRKLEKGVHLVVATPGRLLDLINQGHIQLDRLETFVVDEADLMLDMGFLPDLKRIFASLPDDCQKLFFSATLHSQIRKLANSLLRDPVSIDVSPKSLTVNRIQQQVLFVQQFQKQRLLHHLLQEKDQGRTLVFTRTKRGADQVAKNLRNGGFQADAIHSNKSQNFRSRILKGFRSGHIQVLVATDVAARGIDVAEVTHVINYDMPQDPESYVHRIGRTGRAGADGIALSFCDSSERSNLRAIEKLIRTTIRIEPHHPFHTDTTSSPDPQRGEGRRNKRSANGSKRKKGLRPRVAK
ncbi:MAG: DEAD/DEAH box helicase [Gemmataceae bacterium]